MDRKTLDALERWRKRPDIFVRECFGVVPDAWQDDVLQAFPSNQRQAMVACKGPGKAQPVDIIIETPEGKQRFGDLKEGDLVFAGDGTPTKIKAVYYRGVLPVYDVSFDDGSSTLACGEHLWKIRGRTERRHNTWSVLSTEQIIKRGVREKNGRWAGRHFEIPRQGAVQYPSAAMPVDPYFLGVWIGDGVRKKSAYASKPTPEIGAELTRRELRISEPRDGLITVYGQSAALRKIGIFDLYSHQRFIPEELLRSSVEQRKDILCGLMDSDGGIDADGHMSYSTTSFQLSDDIIWLVRSLGGIAFRKSKVKEPFYYGKDGEKIKGKLCYCVTIVLPFNPFRLLHRQVRWSDPNRSPSTVRYMTRRLDAIKLVGEKECMCIEVEHPDKLYLTNDFIVTHNTALLAWLCWNFLLTRPYPKIAATSITGDNLADNLWAEMAKWQQKSELLRHIFQWTKTRIFAKTHPETWWMSARPWSKSADASQQGNTLAGLHADYIMFVLDESGGIPTSVMAAAEAALSSCIEGHIVQAGNPTHLEGPLYAAATNERRLWHLTNISADPDDPKRTPRVKAEWAREQIEKYGRDNPYVLVNVFGQFPPSSINSLIGPDEVNAAMKRDYRPQDFSHSSRVLGVDVAREGLDTSVIFPRQGIQAFTPIQYRNIDGTQGAGLIARKWSDWDADACFIDDTGGFGSSWIDNLRRLGFSPVGVHFAEKSASPRYFNKRTEMMFEAVQWIKDGGALPFVPELLAALTQTTYTFKGDKLIIEPKESIKERLGYSPDHLDSFMLTFAHPVLKQSLKPVAGNYRHEVAYDPLAIDYVRRDIGGGHKAEYDPLSLDYLRGR